MFRIEFAGELTCEQYVDAMALHPYLRPHAFYYAALELAMLLFLAWYTFVDLQVFAITLSFLVYVVYWRVKQLTGRKAQNRRHWLTAAPDIKGPLQGMATERGLFLRTAVSKLHWQYRALTRVVTNDRYAIAYQGPSYWMIFARHWFKDHEEWDRFRSHLREAVKNYRSV